MSVDYSKRTNWLSLPESDRDVDTFYLYPSSYVSPKGENKPFADIRDENMVRIAGTCLDIQGSAFSGRTNVYAPLYRQVDPFMGFRFIEENKQDLVDEVILTDAIDSFDFYIKNFNKGKPFILAGHSQGTTLLMKVLATYLKDKKELLNKMVAAYMIGYGVTEEYMKENKHLRFAKGETDTGVLISWNTEKPELEESTPIVKEKSLCINPLNWRRDATYAPVNMNLGSLIKGKIVRPGIADAKINVKKGTLECSTVKPEDYRQVFDIFPVGCYHSMDYGFYYENIRVNAAKRIEAFKKKL